MDRWVKLKGVLWNTYSKNALLSICIICILLILAITCQSNKWFDKFGLGTKICGTYDQQFQWKFFHQTFGGNKNFKFGPF